MFSLGLVPKWYEHQVGTSSTWDRFGLLSLVVRTYFKVGAGTRLLIYISTKVQKGSLKLLF